MDDLGPPFFEEVWEKKTWFATVFRLLQRQSKSVAVTGTTHTVGADEGWIRSDATAGAVTVTLPSAAEWKDRVIGVIKTDASGNAVSVSRSGSDVINGASSVSLASRYYNVLVKSDGTTNWDIVSRFPAIAG